MAAGCGAVVQSPGARWGCVPVWRFGRLSVRAQLMLLLVAVLLPVLGVLLYHLAHGRQMARDFASERVRLLAQTTAASLEHVLRDHEAVLQRIAQRPMVMALDGQACDPIIVEFVKLYPEFTNLVVQDLAGRNDCSYLSQKITRDQLSGIPGFRDAINRTSMSVGGGFGGALVRALDFGVVLSRQECAGPGHGADQPSHGPGATGGAHSGFVAAGRAGGGPRREWHDSAALA